jgi:hypothetical protein
MSEGEDYAEEDILSFYNQPLPANSAVKMTATQRKAFSDYLEKHIKTVVVD